MYVCPFFQDYLDSLMGVCYDGVEGLLYLSLFSLLAACTLSGMLCAVFRVWTLMASRLAPSSISLSHLRYCPQCTPAKCLHKRSLPRDKEYDDIDEEDPFNPDARRMSYNPRRSNVHSFCSYTSSLGSVASLHPPPNPTTAPPEYM